MTWPRALSAVHGARDADARVAQKGSHRRRRHSHTQRDFDYTAVDSNDAYDDLDQEQADALDRYFDDEEPAVVADAGDGQDSGDGLDEDDEDASRMDTGPRPRGRAR